MTPICVPPAMIPDLWAVIQAIIEPAFEDNRGDDDAKIIYQDLCSGFSLLWLAWNAERMSVMGAVVTKLLDVPRGKVCRITACGGREMDRWKDGLADIESYAKAEGCRFMRFEGRKGFERLFPEYRQPWIVLEKELG